MIKPFTCICLVLAAGSGLYLYQVKQRAFALDAQLRSTFHGIDVAREKTRMLRADWALMNDPERLQSLANQYLTLQPMAPAQLMTLDQLAVALPAPVAPGAATPAVSPETTAPAAPAPGMTDPTHGVPMASAAPVAGATDQAVALLQPATPAPAPAVPASAPAVATAAIDVLPPDVAPPAPPLPVAPVVQAARLAAVTVPAPAAAPVHHTARRPPVPAVSHQPVVTQSALAAATPQHPAAPAPAPHKARAVHPAAPAGQLYAANEPQHQSYMPPRITPSAATVIYRPVSSSLGMAGSGTLAPPRPLYATTQ